MKNLICSAIASIFSITVGFAQVSAGLNGATGNIYNFDLKAQAFELVKEIIF